MHYYRDVWAYCNHSIEIMTLYLLTAEPIMERDVVLTEVAPFLRPHLFFKFCSITQRVMALCSKEGICCCSLLSPL
jgi:hypothetical protein